VAGCNSDEARDVAMVAAEKRPRPAGPRAEWFSWKLH